MPGERCSGGARRGRDERALTAACCQRPRGSAFARIAAAVKMIGDLMLLAAEAHCLVVSGGAQLYLQGEAASTSFIVLQGSIHIYARDAASQAIVDDQRARRAADGKDGWDLLVPHGEKVAELVEGACFGASGLLDAAAPAVRRDTAIVESGSATLLVLDYGSVRALFGLDAETRRRVTVLGRSALFAEWPRMQLARLASVATVATFGNGSFVVRSGDGADTLYFIESGVVIERAVAKHATHGRVGRGDAGGVVAAADSGGTSGGRPSHAGGAGGHASGSGGGGGAGTSGASGHPQDWPVDISMYVESDIIGERPLFFDGAHVCARADRARPARTRKSDAIVRPQCTRTPQTSLRAATSPRSCSRVTRLRASLATASLPLARARSRGCMCWRKRGRWVSTSHTPPPPTAARLTERVFPARSAPRLARYGERCCGPARAHHAHKSRDEDRRSARHVRARCSAATFITRGGGGARRRRVWPLWPRGALCAGSYVRWTESRGGTRCFYHGRGARRRGGLLIP